MKDDRHEMQLGQGTNTARIPVRREHVLSGKTEVKMEVKLQGRLWVAGKGTWKSACIRALCLRKEHKCMAQEAREGKLLECAQ